MRFFFDYTMKDRALYDYSGDDFKSPQSAIEFAGAIAEYLKHSMSTDWLGWWIEVRNADGMKLVSLPVASSGST